MPDLVHNGKHLRRVGSREFPLDSVSGFCNRRNIRKLALFGSVLREDFDDKSDIDVLVEYKPEHVPGLEFFSHQEEVVANSSSKCGLKYARFVEQVFS